MAVPEREQRGEQQARARQDELFELQRMENIRRAALLGSQRRPGDLAASRGALDIAERGRRLGQLELGRLEALSREILGPATILATTRRQDDPGGQMRRERARNAGLLALLRARQAREQAREQAQQTRLARARALLAQDEPRVSPPLRRRQETLGDQVTRELALFRMAVGNALRDISTDGQPSTTAPSRGMR